MARYIKFTEVLRITRLQARKIMQDALALHFTVTRHGPGNLPAIEKQSHPVPGIQESIRQGSRGQDGILEYGTLPKIVRPAASIEDETDIGGAFLFILIGKNILGVPGGGTPVYPTGRITLLVLAHVEEFHARTALPGRDGSGKDARTTRLDGHPPQAQDRRQDEQLTVSGQVLFKPRKAQMFTGSGVDFFQPVISAPAPQGIRPSYRPASRQRHQTPR